MKNTKPKAPNRPPSYPQRRFQMETRTLAAHTARFLANELEMGEVVTWWGNAVLVRESVGDETLTRVGRVVQKVDSLYKFLK